MVLHVVLRHHESKQLKHLKRREASGVVGDSQPKRPKSENSDLPPTSMPPGMGPQLDHFKCTLHFYPFQKNIFISFEVRLSP